MTVIDAGLAEALAGELLEAEDSATAVAPLIERHEHLTADDAYAVQQAGRRMRLARGAQVVGRKVGLTSAAMQQLLGVDEPDFGYLTDAMLHADGDEIALDGLVAPRVEAEIALRLGRPLAGADVGFDEAHAAIAEVGPALEVVDSRVIDWRITLPDTIADNASSGLAVIGPLQPLGELDLAAVEMEITVEHAGGEREIERGPGAAVLGHPVNALVWLVRALAPYGEGIAAGEIVIPGAMARAITLSGAAQVRARFDSLGEVGASFTGSRR
jgi:2-keto-4-pentenoate hydratase